MQNAVARVDFHVPAGRWLAALIIAVATLGTAPALAQRSEDRAEYSAGRIQFLLPDRWSVESGKQKLTLVAPNEDGFVQFTLLQPGTDAALRAQAARALTTYLSDTVLADPGDSLAINGMPGFRVTGSGTSDATNVQFIAVVISPAPSQPVMILAYASEESLAAHMPIFEALMKSLRRR